MRRTSASVSTFVREPPVCLRAEWIQGERIAVAAIQKGINEDFDVIIGEKERVTARLIRRKVMHIILETFKSDVEGIRIVRDVNGGCLRCRRAALRLKLNELPRLGSVLPTRIVKFPIDFRGCFG